MQKKVKVPAAIDYVTGCLLDCSKDMQGPQITATSTITPLYVVVKVSMKPVAANQGFEKQWEHISNGKVIQVKPVEYRRVTYTFRYRRDSAIAKKRWNLNSPWTANGDQLTKVSVRALDGCKNRSSVSNVVQVVTARRCAKNMKGPLITAAALEKGSRSLRVTF